MLDVELRRDPFKEVVCFLRGNRLKGKVITNKVISKPQVKFQLLLILDIQFHNLRSRKSYV